MKKNYVYLNSFQMYGLIEKIAELKSNNPFFYDKIVEKFVNYYLDKTVSNFFALDIIKLINKKALMYKIPTEMYIYLKEITNIDVFDSDEMNKCINNFMNENDYIKFETKENINEQKSLKLQKA